MERERGQEEGEKEKILRGSRRRILVDGSCGEDRLCISQSISAHGNIPSLSFDY